MNMTLSTDNTSHNYKIVKPYNFLIIISFLCIIQNIKSQNKQAELLDSIFKVTINRNLSPPYDTAKYDEIIRYVELPSFNPEFSIRILESENTILLEVYIFPESFQSQLMKNFIENNLNTTITPVTSSYYLEVSNKFKHTIKRLFISACNEHSKNNTEEKNEVVLDGTNYSILIFNKKIISTYFCCPNKNTIAYKTTTICKNVAEELRDSNFNEKEIVDKINAILNSKIIEQ